MRGAIDKAKKRIGRFGISIIRLEIFYDRDYLPIRDHKNIL